MTELQQPVLPSGWRRLRVGDVLRLQNGYAFKQSEWSSVGDPIIRIQNLKSHSASFNHYEGSLPERFRARTGDVLFAWSGTPGTSFGAHVWRGGNAWINQHIFRVDYPDDVYDREFLRFALNVNVQSYIEQAQGGVGLAHITKKKLVESTLITPPLAEQRRIVRILNDIEQRREAASKSLTSVRNLLVNFRRAILASACSGRLTEDWQHDHPDLRAEETEDLLARRRAEQGRRFKEVRPNPHASESELPEKWSRVPLGLLLRDLKYGTSKRSDYAVDGTPVIRIPNVSGPSFDSSDLKFAVLADGERDDLSLAAGDLLMIRSNGSAELVGKAMLVPEKAYGMAFAGYLLRLRLDVSSVDPAYVEMALSSPDLRTQIELPARSTSGVHNINSGEVRSLVVALPPISEQREIVRRVEALLKANEGVSVRVEAASSALERVSQAALGKAFRGELLESEMSNFDEPPTGLSADLGESARLF